jgi:hypothetical protein
MQRNLLIVRGALNFAFALYFLAIPAADAFVTGVGARRAP